MLRTDIQLLRAFVESGDEAAFTELVTRRIDFVYASASRQLGGDTHRAEDVVQQVFIKLARYAPKLVHHPALLGWLCTTTRFAAVDLIRAEQRRTLREQEADCMHATQINDAADWDRLQPVLDAALTELPALDREMILARYFDRQSYGRLGSGFGFTENAAQKRVDRALDKLRAALARRQVTSTRAAVALILANHPAMAAPAGLAAAVTKSAVALSGAGSTLGAAAIVFTSAQKYLGGALAAALLGGIGAVLLGARAVKDAEAAVAAAERQSAAMTRRLRELELRTQSEEQRVQRAEAENGRLLQAAEQMRNATAAPAVADDELLTSELVTRRLRLAQQLMETGDPAAALRELIWCYDVGMPRFSGMSGLRGTLPLLFARLGERYPPAIEELGRRRDKARELYLAEPEDAGALRTYAGFNHALKNDAENVALLDRLPPGDPRRRPLLNVTRDHLIELRRYREASEGRSYGSISSHFEIFIQERPLPADTPNPGQARIAARTAVVNTVVKDIEMLAGSGDVIHARELARRLLAYDNSEATRALIQQHAARAGQPDVLTMPPPR
jgi:RNA polymerase sigma factor (sigma-70 family)